MGKLRAPSQWLVQGIVWLACWQGAGCSKVLNFDPNGLACDNTVRNGYTYFCRNGYSCETASTNKTCLRDHSVRLGKACTLTRQCATDAICAVDLLGGGGVRGDGGVLTCLPACLTGVTPEAYLQAGGCKDARQICSPFLDSIASNNNKNLIGGCTNSAGCQVGAACTLGGSKSGTCVAVADGATTCLPGCQVTWNGSSYADNCDSVHACQPVGKVGQQAFVCVYNGKSSNATPLASIDNVKVGGVGSACATVSAPCSRGNVCSPTTATCAPYCQLTSNNTSSCPTNQQCCPFTTFATAPATSGYCAASCN